MRLALEVDYAHDRFLGPRAPVLTQSQYQIRDPKRPSLLQSYPAQGDDDDEDVGESMAAQPRLLSKLPTVRGIVNQKIRNVSDDQAACRSASNLDVPKEREKEKEGRKADDAYPNRRPNEVTWTPARWVGRRLHPG